MAYPSGGRPEPKGMMARLAAYPSGDSTFWAVFPIVEESPQRGARKRSRDEKGGLRVEVRLQRLGPGWHVLSDVALGEGLDLDHLVIGMPGLFVITRYDTRAVPQARRPVDRDQLVNVLRVAQHEARAIARRLSRLSGHPLTAWPVVVINDGTLNVTKASGDAYVVAEQLVIPWLKSLMPVLEPDVVDSVVTHALSPETWALGA